MRIVHIDLTGPFTEGMNYQENVLSSINARDGHEVYFVATNCIWKNNKIEVVLPENKRIENDIQLIRMPYQNLMFPLLTDKLRLVKGLKHLLESIQPDVIFLHGYQTLSTIAIAGFLKKNRHVKLAVDTHADAFNSAQNLFSKIILHEFVYSIMAKIILRYTKSIWCISRDVMSFSEKVNKIPVERLEYYPLGGEMIESEEYQEKRIKIRASHNIAEEDILLVHSGKMDKSKKTVDILKAIQRVRDIRLKLIIVGTMDEEVEMEFQKLTSDDKRVQYVGWKNGDELIEYLCAADIYVQPGTQSATMQNAVCCRCALALYPYESHKYLLGENAFYIKDDKDIEQMLIGVLANPKILEKKRNGSTLIAKEKLDYNVLAAQLYNL